MVTFVVENTNPSPVMLTQVSTHLNASSSSTNSLYYYGSQINQAGTWSMGQINNGVNGWNLISTQTVNVATAGVVPALTGLSFVIPVGATYTFAISSSGGLSYFDLVSGAGINTFSGGGVNLKTGDGISWGGPVLPGTPANYPRGFIGSITIVSMTPCAAPIAGGTITNAPTTVCPSTPLNLSVNGLVYGSGMTYQWQESTNGINWTNIAGATLPTLSNSISAATNIRLRSVCSNGNDTAYTPPVYINVSPFMNCYCPATILYTGDGDISKVSIGSLNNISAAACNQYTDFTSLAPTSLFIGMSYPMTVTVDDCTPSYYYANGVAVFIDFNQNGSFNDPGEKVLATPSQGGSANGFTVAFDHVGTVTIPVGALTGITRMRVMAAEGNNGATMDPCTSYNYGEVEDYFVFIAPQPTDEVALLSIDNPTSSSCSFGNSIDVTILNNGSNAITSLDFSVNTGGITQPVSWTGNIAPGATQSVTLPGVYSFNNGDTLAVTVSNPNGMVDFNTTDNSVGFRTYLALSGHYSVGYGVTNISANQFADVVAAVQAAYARGICDTVYFNLKDGIYSNTQFQLIGEYFNYAQGDLIVFQSETKNANNLSVQFTNTSSLNYIVRLDNTRGWAFKHMTFEPLGTSYRTAFEFANASSNISIDSCRFIGSTSLTGAGSYSANVSAIRTSTSTSEHYLTFANNFFTNFSCAFYLYGVSSNQESNIVIHDNKFEKIFNTVAYGYYVQGLSFKNNDVKMGGLAGAGSSTNYLMYLSYCTSPKIDANKFETDTANTGFYMNYVSAGIEPSLFTNNFYYNSVMNGNAAFIRLLSGTNGVGIYNNSMYTRTSNTTYAMIDIDGGASYRIVNNNLHAAGSQEIMNCYSAGSLVECDYNNYYKTTGNYVNIGGTTYASLASWQAGSIYDAHSVSVDPLFIGSDLHTCVSALNAAGTSVPLTYDIDGDLRGAMPDIGADEFNDLNSSLIVNDSIQKCAAQTIQVDALFDNGYTYTWAPGGETTSSIQVQNPGTYIVSVTGYCGAVSDTVVVEDLSAVTAAFNTNGSYGLVAFTNNSSVNGNSYLWDFGDGGTSTDENPTHYYSASGVYTITLTVYGDCDTVSIIQVFNAVALSTENFEMGSVQLYPNPTTSNVNIVFSGVKAGDANIRVLDISGKVVRSLESNIETEQTLSLDVSSLAPGVYYISIRFEKEVKQLKFIKK